MNMTKILVTAVVTVATITAYSQTQKYDYLWIQEVTVNQYVIASTMADPEVVEFDAEDFDRIGKGIKNAVKNEVVLNAAARFQLVQQYEDEGWELFEINDHFWLMRRSREPR